VYSEDIFKQYYSKVTEDTIYINSKWLRYQPPVLGGLF
jgi:hypothetical protein